MECLVLDFFKGSPFISKIMGQAESKEDVSQLANDFQKLLECPVCFGTMDSTLKQCVNGHGVCNDCATKVEKCPSCQQELVAVFHQNTLLKQLLDRLAMPCRYAGEGCTDVVLDKDHQTYCQHRPTKCMIDRCEWKGCVKDLLEHVKSCLSDDVVPEIGLDTEKKIPFSCSDDESTFYPFTIENELFWICTNLQCNNDGEITVNCIFQSVYHVPVRKPRFKYCMTMSFSYGDTEFKHSCEPIMMDNIKSFTEGKITLCGVLMSAANYVEFLVKNKCMFTIKVMKKALN